VAVEAANAKLSRVEQVKRFVILPVSWEPGGDEITPTMKLKRRAVTVKYADVIDSLYAAPSEPGSLGWVLTAPTGGARWAVRCGRCWPAAWTSCVTSR
jgi:hypothetical protein